MLIADRLTDHFGDAAVVPVRKAFLDKEQPTATRIQCLWVLHRQGVLSEDDLAAAVSKDSPAQLRIHAFRALGATAEGKSGIALRSVARWLQQGFRDPASLVRRAAVLASARHPLTESIVPLIALYGETPEEDPHLRHVTRMALRDQLATKDGFDTVASLELDQSGKQLIADVCLALDSEASGAFLLRHVTDVEISDRVKLGEILRQIATTVSGDRLAQVVKLAETRFTDDTGFQLDLLAAVKQGLDERDVSDPAVQDWAARLARQLLHLEVKPEDAPVEWAYLQHPGTPDRGNPWVVSNRRNSADGEKSSLLYSSFPKGEQWTGIYRSPPFVATEKFSFWSAGHIGPPGQPVRAATFIRMKDAETLEVLHEAMPPRNDTAHRTEWNTQPQAGRRVIIELADGDTRGAYAWMAVGRFSEPRLNPSRVPEDRQKAASIIVRFGLREFVEELKSLLRQAEDRGETTRVIGVGVGLFAKDSRMVAVADSLTLPGLDEKTWQSAINALADDEPSAVPEILKQAMQSAPAGRQVRLAEQLLSGSASMTQLVELIESGAASARLLTRPAIAQKIDAAASPELKSRVEALTEGLPSEDENLAKLIAERRKTFVSGESSLRTGAELFKKNCSICHQVAGQGTEGQPESRRDRQPRP